MQIGVEEAIEGKYSLIVTDLWNVICGGDSGEPKVFLTTNLSRDVEVVHMTKKIILPHPIKVVSF